MKDVPEAHANARKFGTNAAHIGLTRQSIPQEKVKKGVRLGRTSINSAKRKRTQAASDEFTTCSTRDAPETEDKENRTSSTKSEPPRKKQRNDPLKSHAKIVLCTQPPRQEMIERIRKKQREREADQAKANCSHDCKHSPNDADALTKSGDESKWKDAEENIIGNCIFPVLLR